MDIPRATTARPVFRSALVLAVLASICLADAGSEDEQAKVTDNAYAKRVEGLKAKLPDGFTIVRQDPFVVVGDESSAVVKRRAERTVGWAVRLLRQDFFDASPNRIIDVYLFRDGESYRKHAKAFWNAEPSTPYGYYSSRHDAMVMNIATGGGTLVHEIVHPFVEADFPDCPAWLNEGLGTLFEQCGERDGHIVGFTNWRLAGLQKAIQDSEGISLGHVVATNTNQFYKDPRGLHYATARYLCYYLQQQGKLRDFYKAFRAGAAEDPTGEKTLLATLEIDSLDDLQKPWERFVMGLRFPDR